MKVESNKGKEPPPFLIREVIREKIFFLYKSSISDLFQILSLADKKLDLFLFYTTNSLLNQGVKSENMEQSSLIVRPHKSLISNSCALIEGIFDEFAGAFHCLTHGFFKEAQGILRGTIESVVQLVSLNFNFPSLPEDPYWESDSYGFSGFQRKLESIKNQPIMKEKQRWTHLRNAYNLTCQATHSKKFRMFNKGLSAGGTPTNRFWFQPYDAFYTISLFVFLMAVEVPVFESIFPEDDKESEENDKFLRAIHGFFKEVLKRLCKFERPISCFEKGYLLRKEHAIVRPGFQVLYSVDTEGFISHLEKKKKFTEDDLQDFHKAIQKRFCNDVY